MVYPPLFAVVWFSQKHKNIHWKKLENVMKDMQPHTTIDVRSFVVPISLLKVENRLAEMTSGQIVEVLCADRETKTDLIAIMRNSNHRCLSVEENSDHFRLLIEKRDD